MVAQLPLRLILASGSAGRRALLQQAGYGFEVRPADIDEPTDTAFGDIRHYVADTAWRKASAVSRHVEGDALVLAADTVAWLGTSVIGKPEDREDARRIIAELSGRTHELWTGVVLWHRPSDRQLCWQERSEVAFRSMTPADIEAYLDTRQWAGCSGAYAVRDTDDPDITIVSGTLSNVIGLPVESLARVLAARWYE